MVRYDFLCQSCGLTFEEMVRSINSKPRCPQCNSRKTKRLISIPAVVNTETQYLVGKHSLADQFRGAEWQLEELVSVARKHNKNPSQTDIYVPGLARFPGDPRAFAPGSDPLGYIKKVCLENGIDCYGAVNVKHNYIEPGDVEKKKRKTKSEKVSEFRSMVQANIKEKGVVTND